MLQALNILENTDVKSMGYNSPKYIHALYQTMNLAFADRDFYYGDPAFPPEEPVKGLLSKEYAKARFAQIDWTKNDPNAKPGDPYPFQGGTNPFTSLLWRTGRTATSCSRTRSRRAAVRIGAWCRAPIQVARASGPTRRSWRAFYAGTTSIEAADEEGWVVSVTPSGGWVPAVIAGRTGIGLSQRAQSFVTEAKDGPFNVIEPGKRPRVTLTPTLALKDGEPYLAFAVQGGDSQDQNLLQFFLNVVEFGMTVQQAVEAPNVNSYQMRSSFGAHESRPGRMTVASSLPGGDSSGAPADGIHAGVRGAIVGADQRDLVRSEASDDVGWVEQSRRRLRHWVVTARMPHSAAIPFLLQRRHDVVGLAITTTRETVHGLLRLDGDTLHVQWRVARSTDYVGMTIRSDKQVEPRAGGRDPSERDRWRHGEMELAMAAGAAPRVDGR